LFRSQTSMPGAGRYVEYAFIVFIETPSNPLNAIADIAGLAQISRDIGAILAVDNCFCTPALQTASGSGS
jgi:O-succinylhomoserine sulfhydrylase